MSLATTSSAGLGGGGAGLASSLAMNHHSLSVPSTSVSPAGTSIPGQPPPSGGTTAVPGTSWAVGAADLLDRNSQKWLSAKSVRTVARLPIVAVDLYGECRAASAGNAAGVGLAYFPPVNTRREQEEEESSTLPSSNTVQVKCIPSSLECTTQLTLRRSEPSYKAVKRYLTKGEGHEMVLREAMLESSEFDSNGGILESNTSSPVVTIPNPHLLLGVRNLSQLSPVVKSKFASIIPNSNTDANTIAYGSTSSSINEDSSSHPMNLTLTTISLNGEETVSDSNKNIYSNNNLYHDNDRVAFQIRLHSKKKALSILPEEAVSLILASFRKKVQEVYFSNEDGPKKEEDPSNTKEEESEVEESYLGYPMAFAIPGWAALDPTMEALIDAATSAGGEGCGPCLYQRSIAACVGALLPLTSHSTATTSAGGAYRGTSEGKKLASGSFPPSSRLTSLLMETINTKNNIAAKEAAKEAALKREDPVEPDPFIPLILLAGATNEGLELTAVQVSKPQSPNMELHCPFGNINVISSVCYCHEDPLSLVEKAMDEVRAQVGWIAPESEEPTAILTYGGIGTQVKLATKVKSILQQYGVDKNKDDDDWDGWDQDISILSTKEECVSTGLAVLAASVHGRVRLVVSVKGTDGKYRPKAKLAVAIQDVSTCAVAVSCNYFGGVENKWTFPPKVIFDFDRRVPAGPHQIEFTAAECAAHVKHCSKEKNKTCCNLEDELTLIEQAKSLEGTRYIPERESAALELRFRIYQKTTRGSNGEWIRVGDDMRPLSMEHSQKDEGESGEENLVACESAVLEISLGTVGSITTELITNGETIVQATKSARNSKLLRWGGIIGSVLFIGGFLIKSYVEERIFERDTQRVMAYYRHAAPNSFHDGDERQARYLVWKYKGKKDALWRRLEAKYNIPVKHAWEWEEVEKGTEENQEETEDLDGDDRVNNEL